MGQADREGTEEGNFALPMDTSYFLPEERCLLFISLLESKFPAECS